jgi:hypothetical protein
LSAPAAKLYENNSLDFIMIGGDHNYEGVKKDLIAWRPKMKDGAIMAGDDYNALGELLKLWTNFLENKI